MSDLVLGAAECVFCSQPVKGYISGDANELVFAHVASADHRAFPDLDTFEILPAEVWHAIAVESA